MSSVQFAVKKLTASLLNLPAIFALSGVLVSAGCGGGGSSTGGGSTPPTPTPTPSTAKEWTWVSGSNSANAIGVYGTLGTASASNVPGSRAGAVSWIDKSGNLWLFGGTELDGTVLLNDLWEFSPTSKEWTWVSGSSTGGSSGVYGTQGVAAAANVPGARVGSASWIDSSGNLWLFGGTGLASIGGGSNFYGYLNDLWEFSPTSKEWTWVSGTEPTGTTGSSGVYGTLGVAAATNVPGGRQPAASWIDKSGNLWLFGGIGYDSTVNEGDLNDLWEFNPTSKEWTWVSGKSTANWSGNYGTLGTPSATNVPGSRYGSASWIDSSGNLWLFGGSGFGSGAAGGLNDLWEYSLTSKEWTWVSGSSTAGASGVYGTQGVAAAANVPGARSSSVSWIDSSGNLWLFGGGGIDSTGASGGLNDLWEFSPTAKEWTWVSGSSSANATGVYGTLGTAAASNVPGARGYSVSWTDASGNFWLFGGDIFATSSAQTVTDLNDLWEYQP